MRRPLRTRLSRLIVAVGLVGLLALAGCGTGPFAPARPSVSVPAGDQLYVSIGDSYAAGYQPSSANFGSTSQNGFAYQVVAKAAANGSVLRLVNFGCSGETSVQVVSQDGCQQPALGPGAPTYDDQPQADAALALMRADPGAVKLVTIIMGGNDVRPCVESADRQSCLDRVVPVLSKNVATLVASIRQLVGPSVKIIGLTYPDIFLGAYAQRTAAATELAISSRTIFRRDLNPALKSAYTDNGAEFVDITAATGAYGSLQQTTEVAPYGTLPLPAARICQLTYFCQYSDVHPTTQGYALIADEVLKAATS